jgi:hypothetical protein
MTVFWDVNKVGRNVLSRFMYVTIDGVRIREWIY